MKHLLRLWPRTEFGRWLVHATVLAVVCIVALSPTVDRSAGAVGDRLAGSQVEPVSVVAVAERWAGAEAIAQTEALPHSAFLPLVSSYSGESLGAPFGVQLLSVKGATVLKTSQVGAAWVRMPFYWTLVEPVNTTPDNYYWPPDFDEVLADLASRNIKVILTLAGNPQWAATYPSGPIDKVEVAELVQFMEAAVARYGQPPYNVKHWEFYNEPDNGEEIHGQGGHGYFGNEPEAYVTILRAVYGPLKAIDPEALVVFGGIAYDRWTTDPENPGPFVQNFLDRVLEEGGADFFDVMNFHYYPLFHGIWDVYGKGIIGKATFLRRKLDAHGVDKPFICTEAGLASDAAHGGSDELQSRYVVQVLTRGMAAELGTTIWFHFVDEHHLGSSKFGLLNVDLSPKPSYWAYQTFAGQLSSADFVRALAPGKDGPVQVEGYEFDVQLSPERIVVAWSNDGASHPLVVQTSAVTVVDKYGGVSTVLDGDDGVVDGRVVVSVSPSPVYVKFSP